MKIYILADMEGISGIRDPGQVLPDSREYEHGRKLLIAEINAAVKAAFEGGATEVVVNDAHWKGLQIRMDQMDERAIYETNTAGRLMPSLDASFRGVILLGHHAKAGTMNAFLDHTMSPDEWFSFSINGKEVGEIGLEAAYAGHFNVPVIAISGDEAACKEAQELLEDIECAVTKWGLGRHRARCLPTSQAHGLINAAIRNALKSVNRFRPYQPLLPAILSLTVTRTDRADGLMSLPGMERVDARTVQKKIRSFQDIRMW